MTLRVTPQQSVSQFLQRLTSQNSRIADLQTQASSGLRINRPSDDPAGLRSLLRAQEAVKKLETQTETISTARYRLEQANIAIVDSQNLIAQAQSIATQAVQAIEPSEREVLADEIDGILRQFGALANTEVSGEYLFSGIATDELPFADVLTSGQSTYGGSTIPRTLPLHSGPPTLILQSGDKVFQPVSRGETFYIGQTGATAGPGTDSAKGRGTLLVTHTSTTYAPGSGVSAGTDSATGDTIIGQAGAYQLNIVDQSGTGASGAVSLNGGPPVAFTNGDTNLKVVGPLDEVIYIDTTSITPGFSGDVDLTANGTLSTDGGATTIPIDFSTNQAVTDSKTNTITNVDTSAVRFTGKEQLEYTGTSDAFSALRELRDDIRNTRGLSEGEQRDAIARHLTDLERVHDHLLDVTGEQSVTLSELDDVEAHAEDAQLDFKQHIADISNADIAKVALELQQSRSQLQYSLATASGLFDISLLDFLK